LTQEVGTLLMKVQLVVVQGKPEGMTIPLALPQFKIGRGVGCQLKPNDDQVSREHSMFEVTSDSVFLQDLGSRNGTEVNGKKLGPHDPVRLKNGDLVKIGALTFAVSIEGGPVQATTAPPSTTKKAGSLDDLSHDDIDSWLVSDASKEPPDRPSGVYGGDTMSFESLKLKDKPDSKMISTSKAPAPPPVSKPEPVAVSKPEPVAVSKPEPVAVPKPEPVAVPKPEPVAVPEEAEIEQFQEQEEDDGIEDLSKTLAAEAEADMPEDMMDESNPFYSKKKTEAAPVAAKGPQRDSSDAANDILRKMMDRRKAAKS
jgi:predicted component of type VI protein secretion system